MNWAIVAWVVFAVLLWGLFIWHVTSDMREWIEYRERKYGKHDQTTD